MADPYLTPEQLRTAVPPLSDDVTFPDAALAAYVAEFEEVAEQYLGAAYRPRTVTETFLLGYGSQVRVLGYAPIRSVTTMAVDGVEAEALTYELTNEGILYRAVGLTGHLVAVTYEHGFDAPTAVLLRACTQYVRSVALADQSGLARDIIGQSMEGMTVRYSTPDFKAGRPTGYLEVDRLLNSMPVNRVPRIAG